MKEQKGITIVSLVVTIIILIILAGVTITAALGENGIITISKQAKENMQLAQIDEQTKLNELYMQMVAEGGTTGGIAYDEIAKLTEFKKIIAEAITNNGVETSQEDTAETMAENIYKIRNENNNTGITLDNLKTGNYIKYDTGIASIGENGVIVCRVLYRANSEYGLQIISNENLEDITLGGNDWGTSKTSHNEAIKTLNSTAEKYLNTLYAVDARCVGSLPTIDENGNFINKNSETTTTVKTQWSSDTGYKGADTNYEKDKEAIETIGITGTEKYYWLASRYVDSSATGCGLYLRFAFTTNELGRYMLGECNVYGSYWGYTQTYGFRPVFSIKSNVKITGGDGTSEELAYVIE